MAKKKSRFPKLSDPEERRKLLPYKSLQEHGIIYTRLPGGDGRYSINITVDGERIHRVVGREREGVNLAKAERKLDKYRSDAREGRLALPKGRKSVMRFEEAAPMYLKRLAEEGGRNLRAKERHIKLHLLPHFARILLSAITVADIEAYKQMRLAQKAVRGGGKFRSKDVTKLTLTRPGTVNRELATLSHVLHKAVEWGWIVRMANKVRGLPDEMGKIVYLTAPECERLLACARSDNNPLIYPFVFIGLETSMRRMEILSIRREDIDLIGRVIFVPEGKTGSRQQPMTGRLARYLETYLASLPEGTTHLFPSKSSKSGHIEEIRKPFVRVVSAAGLDRKVITPHVMRHTVITHAVHANVDLATVKEISGHKTLAMILRYAHASAPHVRDAMDKLEARFTTAV